MRMRMRSLNERSADKIMQIDLEAKSKIAVKKFEKLESIHILEGFQKAKHLKMLNTCRLQMKEN